MVNRNIIFIFFLLVFVAIGRTDVQAEAHIAIGNVRQSKVLEKDKWLEVYRWVASDVKVPDREDVLELIRYHYKDIEKLEKLLRYLDGGKPYAYISRHILPRIGKCKVEKRNPSMARWRLPAEVLPIAYIEPGSLVPCTISVTEEEEQGSTTETVLALKNNLLYDLALAPNIEVELPIGRRWSLNIEYKCPWWSDSEKSLCYQLLSGGVEVRYWLGNRQTHSRLTGHFFGLYAEGGTYDFQFKEETGYRGKYYRASGFTYGYSRRIARYLALEFSLGIGYLDSEYRKYTSYKDELIWTGSGRYHFIGPTKAKVSLVWLIKKRR